MLKTAKSQRGMVTAPHHLAGEAGLNILRDGGNAIEAMVAMAGAIAVVYPHMNSIGGDGFWLIHVPGQAPIGISACGPAGGNVTAELYKSKGMNAIPARGPLAANTVAGTIGGWQKALEISQKLGGKLSLDQLLEEAIYHGRNGVALTESQIRLTSEKFEETKSAPGFVDTFCDNGAPPKTAITQSHPRLAQTLKTLCQDGLESFYQGPLARQIANDLERAGSPVTLEDLQAYQAKIVEPLSLKLKTGTIFNMTPPTQGLASLMILGIFERLGIKADEAEAFAHIHGLVEAAKQAFLVRDAEITDPAYMNVDPNDYLRSQELDARAEKIDPAQALPWPYQGEPGDTVWLGAIDAQGVAVSFIQSVYWEFGSGVVLEDSGFSWQNRGSSFKLEKGTQNYLEPGRLPFHTLNPALAHLSDGRVMVYGTMGGEGQPQTQSAIYSRYAMFGQDLQAAITAPRWLLGRTWGQETMTLKLEPRFDKNMTEALKAANHDVEIVDDFNDVMGHAGAVVRHEDGLLEGASDPRSDGQARGF